MDLTSLTSGTPFVLKLQTLSGSHVNGSLSSWDGSVNHIWAGIATTTLGVAAFSGDKFFVDTSGFANAIPGTFGVVLNGSNIDLQYLAVPEPSPTLSLLFGTAMVTALRRCRRSGNPVSRGKDLR